MATKANLKDVGWMYHAPALARDRPEVFAPPPSQIPGLGVQEELRPEDLEPKPMIFKSTDTPYIMLAKQGGRPDLLRFRECKPKPPKDVDNYQRCDWFYLEDNALEEEEKRAHQEPYVFNQPEYMVHQSFNPKFGGKDAGHPDKVGRRAPFATTWGQEGNDANALPEHRPFGYGVRLAKQKELDARKKRISKSQSYDQLSGKNQGKSAPKRAEEPISMSKILSNSYARDINQPDKKSANKGAKKPPQPNQRKN